MVKPEDMSNADWDKNVHRWRAETQGRRDREDKRKQKLAEEEALAEEGRDARRRSGREVRRELGIDAEEPNLAHRPAEDNHHSEEEEHGLAFLMAANPEVMDEKIKA